VVHNSEQVFVSVFLYGSKATNVTDQFLVVFYLFRLETRYLWRSARFPEIQSFTARRAESKRVFCPRH